MILSFDPKEESQRIVTFLKKTFSEQKIENAVIGLSGGIDSATSFYLIKKVLRPEHIFIAHLWYFTKVFPLFEQIVKDAKIPAENIYDLSIKQAVDAILDCHPERAKRVEGSLDMIRKGNIMARVRMIFCMTLQKNTMPWLLAQKTNPNISLATLPVLEMKLPISNSFDIYIKRKFMN